MKKYFFNRYGSLRPFWAGTLVVVAMLGFILIVCGLVAGSEYAKCNNLASRDLVNLYDWSFWSGCRVQISSGFFVDVDSPSMYELIHNAPRQ